MKIKFIKPVIPFIIFLCYFNLNAQNNSDNQQSKSVTNSFFNEFRAMNTADLAIGSSVMNGDFVDPLFEIYMHIGYKRFIIPHLNINFGYNKFNLAYKDVFNEGFMSFDLNLESLILPNERFTPYVFAGVGLNASNYFKQTDLKVQGGVGLQYMMFEGLGIKLFTDYNHVFSDELDGKIFGDADDVYWRLGLGLNYYFGNSVKKEKILDDETTIIKSNPILPKN